MTPEAHDRYLAYLLRLWPAQGEGGASWRASLEPVAGGERRAFRSLEALMAYLSEQTEGHSPEDRGEDRR
jgi:hypothetical protein